MVETDSFCINQKKIENANRLCYDYDKSRSDASMWYGDKPSASLSAIGERIQPGTSEDMQMKKLYEALEIPKGVTAVVGGGGKTSLIDELCRQLSGKILRLTTTRILPPKCPCLIDPRPSELRQAFEEERVLCIASYAERDKLALPAVELEPLLNMADYVLVEADGSRGLPLKAPNDKEPYLTGWEAMVIAMAGMRGLQQPIAEAAHRAERYAALIRKTVTDTASPEDAAAVLESDAGLRKRVSCRFAVVLNQCDTPERLQLGRECAAALQSPCFLTRLESDPEWWMDGKEG